MLFSAWRIDRHVRTRALVPDKRESRRRAMRRRREPRHLNANGSMMRDFNIPGRSAAMAANGMAATSHPMATLGRARRAALGRQCGRCRDRGGRHAVRRRAAEHRDRRRLLHPLFAAGRLAGRAQRLRAALPAKATVEWYVEHGIGEIGVQTPHAVTVPGAIDAWCTFNREYGTRPLAELLEPAARAAEDGYVVTPRVAADWHRAQEKLRDPVTAGAVSAGRQTARPPATRCATRRSPPPCAGSGGRAAKRFTTARSCARSSPGSNRSAGCTKKRISRPSARTGSSRSMPLIAATRSMNAHRMGRAWRR